MRRLLIVYNPRSSRFIDVEKEVLSKVRNLEGYMVGKYEVEPTDVDKNSTKFAKLLKDGDLVVSAGGDATGIIASNGILKSEKNVTLAVLPYGNFNDLARTLGTKTIEDVFSKDFTTKKLYPLEIYIDGKFFRYATCYMTIGMTAEACELFDEPDFRKEMQKGHKSSWRSYIALSKWYFKNRHKKEFIPPFTLNGKPTASKVSDYCALSGRSMCRVMKGGDDYLKPKVFRSENCRLTNLWRLTKLMTASILKRTPGTETKGDKIEFLKPATVELQAEGEYRIFKNIKTIEVKKGKKCLKVIHTSSR
ncbi:hypothetical protein IKW73_01125 [Candidatus Saccharibacteria bacterium]|nr:hypothetical protein [Candidatus Saccharibacteria bacterium]